VFGATLRIDVDAAIWRASLRSAPATVLDYPGDEANEIC
jgi:hypothetical protein